MLAFSLGFFVVDKVLVGVPLPGKALVGLPEVVVRRVTANFENVIVVNSHFELF